MLAALLGSLSGFWALIDRGYRLGMRDTCLLALIKCVRHRTVSTPRPLANYTDRSIDCRERLYGWRFHHRQLTDVLPDAFCVVALPSRRFCYLDELGDERDMELPLCELVHQVAIVATRWDRAASSRCPFLLGAYSR